MKTYSEKLKDPRWQKLRLQVFERDEFTCRKCDCKENTLTVHHRKYHKSGNPWDIDVDYLVTLCEHCHKNVEDNKKEILEFLIDQNYFIGLDRYNTSLVELLSGILENPSLLPIIQALIRDFNDIRCDAYEAGKKFIVDTNKGG